MSAVVVLSPTPLIQLGQAFLGRGQVRDSDTRMPYDLTGAGANNALRVVSLSGVATVVSAAAPALEKASAGTFTYSISPTDSASLAVGRWYLEFEFGPVTMWGGFLLVCASFPVDVVVTP